MKKAIVYDRWLHTLGGGEVVACLIAEALTKNYEVTLISDVYVTKKQIKNKLGVDLKDVQILPIYFDESRLADYTSEAELFINTSFMSYVEGNAKINIMYVHFPTEDMSSIRGWIKRKLLLPFLDKHLSYHNRNCNSHSIIKNGRIAFRCNEDEIAVNFYNVIPGQKYHLKVPIYYEAFSFSSIKNTNIILNNAKNIKQYFKVDHHSNVITSTIFFTAKKNNVTLNVTCEKEDTNTMLSSSDIFLIDPYLFNNSLIKLIPKKILSKIHQRLKAGSYTNMAKRLSTYDLLISNSAFTSKWIQKYWKKDSQVLYPPVNLIRHKGKQKKKDWIVSTGRFFKLGHGKKQEILIEAFKEFYKLGNEDWELHLIGGLNQSDKESVEYVKYLREQSESFPIHFHVNATRKSLEDILTKSKIYWHAAGYQAKKPIQKEHFGISVVEAISADCIPIVVNEGGIPEIISKLNMSSDKFLFNTKEDLVNKTIFWTNNLDNFSSPSKDQLKNYFSKEQFKKRFWNII